MSGDDSPHPNEPVSTLTHVVAQVGDDRERQDDQRRQGQVSGVRQHM